MPVSKSRRKNGKKKTFKLTAYRAQRQHKQNFATNFKQCDVDMLKEIITNVELITELKLPAGNCCYQDAALIRDTINFCTWGAQYKDKISKDLNQDWLADRYPIFLKGHELFGAFYKRGNDKGGQNDDSVRYVATGEELCALRDAIMVAGDFFKQMLEDTPIITVKLFMAMKHFMGEMETGSLQHSFDEETILRTMKAIRWA